MGRCFSCIRLRPTAAAVAVAATSLWDVVVVVVVVVIGMEGRGRYMLIDLLFGLKAVDNPIALWCPRVTIRAIVVATSNDMEVCERNMVRLVVDVVLGALGGASCARGLLRCLLSTRFVGLRYDGFRPSKCKAMCHGLSLISL